MINVTRQKDGLRVEVRGEMEELLDELAHAAYSAACGMLDKKDRKLDRVEAALFAMALMEQYSNVYMYETGDKDGCLDMIRLLSRIDAKLPELLGDESDTEAGERGIMQ